MSKVEALRAGVAFRSAHRDCDGTPKDDDEEDDAGEVLDDSCICEFADECDGSGQVECIGCGGETCVCGSCGGRGESECPGCENCESCDAEGEVLGADSDGDFDDD